MKQMYKNISERLINYLVIFNQRVLLIIEQKWGCSYSNFVINGNSVEISTYRLEIINSYCFICFQKLVNNFMSIIWGNLVDHNKGQGHLIYQLRKLYFSFFERGYTTEEDLLLIFVKIRCSLNYLINYGLLTIQSHVQTLSRWTLMLIHVFWILGKVLLKHA